ncbi:MAG: alpha-L-glutamate ligase-like protein [Thalassolituus sp.]
MKDFLISPLRLKRLGILGMNKRNRDYIARYNERSLFPLVDNKLITRKTIGQAGIPTAELITVVQVQSQVNDLLALVEDYDEFVIKPSKGSGGKGILVITGRDGESFRKASGVLLSADDLKRHVSNILSGLYSLGGTSDVAVIESLIHTASALTRYSVEGVPDIRVIICRGYPVMAMIRLSTHASDGKANLHQGAVGVGLDMKTGCAVRAVQHGKSVTHHPDTGQDLLDLCIPDWDTLLVMAARCYDVTGLGYLGIDMVIDQRYGPMLLELNARPGLTIQVANNAGLLTRLTKVDALSEAQTRLPAEERVRLSQAWY